MVSLTSNCHPLELVGSFVDKYAHICICYLKNLLCRLSVHTACDKTLCGLLIGCKLCIKLLYVGIIYLCILVSKFRTYIMFI